MPPLIITASILAADQTRLQEEVDAVEEYCDWIQVDVMDGKFVPKKVYGVDTLYDLYTDKILDAHLMIEDPKKHIQNYLNAGAGHITFHSEAVPKTSDRLHLIEMIHAGNATAGIAINPDTPLSAAHDVLDHVDLLLVMSVHPGASGQAFLPEVLKKVQEARSTHPTLMIQMDGGINAQTAKLCRDAGANNLVSASYIFGSKDYAAAIAALRT